MAYLVHHYEISERRACKLVEQHRSTQRYAAMGADEGAAVAITSEDMADVMEGIGRADAARTPEAGGSRAAPGVGLDRGAPPLRPLRFVRDLETEADAPDRDGVPTTAHAGSRPASDHDDRHDVDVDAFDGRDERDASAGDGVVLSEVDNAAADDTAIDDTEPVENAPRHVHPVAASSDADRADHAPAGVAADVLGVAAPHRVRRADTEDTGDAEDVTARRAYEPLSDSPVLDDLLAAERVDAQLEDHVDESETWAELGQFEEFDEKPEPVASGRLDEFDEFEVPDEHDEFDDDDVWVYDSDTDFVGHRRSEEHRAPSEERTRRTVLDARELTNVPDLGRSADEEGIATLIPGGVRSGRAQRDRRTGGVMQSAARVPFDAVRVPAHVVGGATRLAVGTGAACVASACSVAGFVLRSVCPGRRHPG